MPGFDILESHYAETAAWLRRLSLSSFESFSPVNDSRGSRDQLQASSIAEANARSLHGHFLATGVLGLICSVSHPVDLRSLRIYSARAFSSTGSEEGARAQSSAASLVLDSQTIEGLTGSDGQRHHPGH